MPNPTPFLRIVRNEQGAIVDLQPLNPKSIVQRIILAGPGQDQYVQRASENGPIVATYQKDEILDLRCYPAFVQVDLDVE